MNHWLFSKAGALYLLSRYVKDELSTYAVARDLGLYPNVVRRALVFHGIPRRDRGTAQKLALKTGRAAHPKVGRPGPPYTPTEPT